MSKQLKPVPKFANEAEERAFWEKHDSTDYLDWTQAKQVTEIFQKKCETDLNKLLVRKR